MTAKPTPTAASSREKIEASKATAWTALVGLLSYVVLLSVVPLFFAMVWVIGWLR